MSDETKRDETKRDDDSTQPPPHRAPGRPKGSRDRGPRKARAAGAPPPLAEVAADERDAKRRKGRDKSFLRSPHGRAVTHGNPGPRVEVPPADEMSSPAKMAHKAPLTKGHRGAFLPGESASAAGRAGGAAKRGKVALGASLGITAEMAEKFPEDLRRAMRKGASYRRERAAELAAMAGGVCGMGPSSMVASAGLALAASRYVFALAALETDPMAKVKLFGLFAKLTAESRQNELAAYELAVREAKARSGGKPADPLGGFTARPVLEAPAERAEAGVEADGANPNSTESVISINGEPSGAVTEADDQRG